MVSNSLYRDLGRPNLIENDIKLSGLSGNELTPIGSFNADILIDNISVSCDVYVLNNLQYDMILGNNFLNKLNFEITDGGLKVTGRRNKLKKCTVNLVTVIPLSSKLDNPSTHSNIPMTYPNLRISSSATPKMEKSVHFTDNQNVLKPNGSIGATALEGSRENKTTGTPKSKSVCSARVANSKNMKELGVAHVTKNAFNEEIRKTGTIPAKKNILKIGKENQEGFNLRPKYLGPYKIIKVKEKDKYEKEKVGFHKGPVLPNMKVVPLVQPTI